MHTDSSATHPGYELAQGTWQEVIIASTGLLLFLLLACAAM